MKLLTKFLIVLLLIQGHISCTGEVHEQDTNKIEPKTDLPKVNKEPQGDTNIVVSNVPIDLLYPSVTLRGCILCLPGWDFNRMDVCNKSNFCKMALDSGFVLILPEMGKSVYHSKIYPETREEWKKYPTLKWLTDTMIRYMQDNFGLLLPGQNNFVYGISTGGRGVGQLATHTKGIFRCGAALSGDFDQTKNPKDNLITGYYGSYAKFPDRWKGEDNPALNGKLVDFPMIMSHGKADKVVPFEQSQIMFDALHNNQKIGGISPKDTGGHNYGFWQSESEFILKMYFSYSLTVADSIWNTGKR